MRLRRWTDTLGPPLIAAAAAAAVFVVPAVAGPAGVRVGGSPPARIATVERALPACPPGPRSAAVERAGPGGAVWYRLDPVLDASGRLDGQRLTVGHVGRRGGFALPLAVESFASGPSDGRVVVGNDDGRRSTVRILDIGARCAIVVYEGRELVRRAVLDVSGAGLVEFRLDRSTRADLGVWSRPLDGSKPRRLLDPLPSNDRIGRVFATELSWSLDGNRLVVTSCGEASCLARILEQSTGRVTTVDDQRVGDVLGLVGDDLVAYGGCPTLPCGIVAMNLRTGDLRDLADVAGLATVEAAKGGALVAFEDYRTGGRLRVIGLDGTARRTLPVGDGLRLVPSSNRALAAIELPPGVIALAEAGRPSDRGEAARFIHLVDGRQLSAAEVVR